MKILKNYRERKRAEKQQIKTINNPNPIAIVGFVLAFLFPVLGIIFSAIGLKKTKYGLCNGKKLAIAGLIISIVYFLVRVFFLYGVFIAMLYDYM